MVDKKRSIEEKLFGSKKSISSLDLITENRWKKAIVDINPKKGDSCYAAVVLTSAFATISLFFPSENYFKRVIIVSGRFDYKNKGLNKTLDVIEIEDGEEVGFYPKVETQVLDLLDEYDVVKLGYDRWNYFHLIDTFKGFILHNKPRGEVVPMGIGFVSLSEATKEYFTGLNEASLKHDGHKGLWHMLSNSRFTVSDKQEIKPEPNEWKGHFADIMAYSLYLSGKSEIVSGIVEGNREPKDDLLDPEEELSTERIASIISSTMSGLPELARDSINLPIDTKVYYILVSHHGLIIKEGYITSEYSARTVSCRTKFFYSILGSDVPLEDHEVFTSIEDAKLALKALSIKVVAISESIKTIRRELKI